MFAWTSNDSDPTVILIEEDLSVMNHSIIEVIWPVLLVALILLFLLVFVNAKNRQGTSKPNRMIETPRQLLWNSPIPMDLGIQTHIPGLLECVRDLERALDETYLAHVKKRVLTEHPRMSSEEYEWYLFELKRFFLMNTLLKSVPMYSTGADDIWHSMLMFSREYQAFCRHFHGEMIHHVPNVDVNEKTDPNQRAWFELFYSHLFKPNAMTFTMIGQFNRVPFSQQSLHELKNDSVETLVARYFNMSDRAVSIGTEMITASKTQLVELDRSIKNNGTYSARKRLEASRSSDSYTSSTTNNDLLLMSMIYTSSDNNDRDRDRYEERESDRDHSNAHSWSNHHHHRSDDTPSQRHESRCSSSNCSSSSYRSSCSSSSSSCSSSSSSCSSSSCGGGGGD